MNVKDVHCTKYFHDASRVYTVHCTVYTVHCTKYFQKASESVKNRQKSSAKYVKRVIHYSVA